MSENASESPLVLRFIHHFSRELSCELQVPAQPPGPGQPLTIQSQWTGRPKPKHLKTYRRWVLLTNQTLADQWGRRLLYALGIAPNRTEFWAFEPGHAPKLLGTSPVGIP